MDLGVTRVAPASSGPALQTKVSTQSHEEETQAQGRLHGPGRRGQFWFFFPPLLLTETGRERAGRLADGRLSAHGTFPVTGQGSSARRAPVHPCGRGGVCHSTGGQVGRDGGACPPRNFSVRPPVVTGAVNSLSRL